MSTGPGPMNATITGGTISTDGVSSVTFTTPIVGYLGGPLFCKVTVSGSILVVIVDKDGPSALGPFQLSQPATHVLVMVKSQAAIATWGGELATPYTGNELAFEVDAPVDLRYVTFAIRPAQGAESPAVADPADTDATDAVLGFITIEVDGQPGTFEVYYLDDPPTVTNYQRLTKATIIPPAQPPGSIGGPMGVQLSS